MDRGSWANPLSLPTACAGRCAPRRQRHIHPFIHQAAPRPRPGDKRLSQGSESLADVRFFQIREIGQQLLYGAAGGHRLHDHSYGHTHTSNTWLSAHDFWIDRDPSQHLHTHMVAYPAAGVQPATELSGFPPVEAAADFGRNPVSRVIRVMRQEGSRMLRDMRLWGSQFTGRASYRQLTWKASAEAQERDGR